MAELEVAEEHGVVDARRRPPDVPPPADALGRLPRRPAGRSPRRPPGARRHPPEGLTGAGVAPGAGRRRARRVGRPGARGGGPADEPARRRRRRPPARGSWPAGCRPTRPTGCAGCASPRWPSSTPGWRRRPGACSIAPTPWCPSTPAADDLIERIRRQQLRCRLPPSGGGSNDPVRALRRAAQEVAGAAPDVAVDLLFDALAAYIRDGAFADMVSAVEECHALRDRVDESRARRIDIMVGAMRIASGRPGGEELLDRYTEMTGISAVRLSADALFLAEVLAPSLAFLRRTGGVGGAARRARRRPAAARRGAPADQRARRPGRRAVRALVPVDDGGGRWRRSASPRPTTRPSWRRSRPAC